MKDRNNCVKTYKKRLSEEQKHLAAGGIICPIRARDVFFSGDLTRDVLGGVIRETRAFDEKRAVSDAKELSLDERWRELKKSTDVIGWFTAKRGADSIGFNIEIGWSLCSGDDILDGKFNKDIGVLMALNTKAQIDLSQPIEELESCMPGFGKIQLFGQVGFGRVCVRFWEMSLVEQFNRFISKCRRYFK